MTEVAASATSPASATLRRWIADVHAGRLPRRQFLQRLAALGLAPPVAAALLAGSATTPARAIAPAP